VIDEIRQDVQARLDEVLDEAERLIKALAALGGPEAHGSQGRASTSRQNGPRTRGATASTPRVTRSAGRRTRRGARSRSGGTKRSVLEALASGKVMTASDVATATGLGRASVSTTLSKLAKSGEVHKAPRGYELTRQQLLHPHSPSMKHGP
jgi:DNA-binding transcriptional ArsR family regulator